MQISYLYTLFIVLGVILIIILGIYIYNSIYKRNINRALDGIHHTKLIDPLAFFQVTLVIVTMTLVILGISQTRKIETLLNNIRSEISSLETKIDFLSGRISSLNSEFDQFYQNQKWVQRATYEFHDYDQTTHTIETKISFTLKEIDTDSLVYLVVTNKDDAEDSTKILVDSTTLNYEKTIDLDTEKIYMISVLSENGTVLQGEQLLRIDLKDIFGHQINFSASFSTSNPNISVSGSLNNLGIDNYTIASAELILYRENGSIHSTVDLTTYIRSLVDYLYSFEYSTDITDATITGFSVRVVDSFGNVEEMEKIDF